MPYEGWTNDALSDDSRDAFFKACVDRQAGAEKDTAAVRKLGLIVGTAGMVAAVIAIAAAAVVYIKTPVQPPPGYIIMDRTTGWISEPITARDAPTSFPETVRQRAMRDFLIACESYIPQTWIAIDWHACMIQATPDEQARRSADIGTAKSPRYPPTVFGPTGWAMPSSFDAYVNRGSVGTEPTQTFSYTVRYQRTEVIVGKETRAHWTAQMTFQFRPELKMSPADRAINPSGLQMISFSTTRD